MTQLRNTSRRRLPGLVVATAALLAAAAACGGGSDAPAPTGGGNGGMPGAFAAYTECLAKNGVIVTPPSGGPRVRPSGFPSDFPSGMPRPSGSARPGGGGFPGGGLGKPAGVDDATWEKAQQACASVMPSGRGDRRGNGMSTAYRNCLQDNGVTLGQGGLSSTDPAVRKAVEACRALAPTPRSSSAP